MTLLDRIEDALRPLRAELTTSCVLCGGALYRRFARAGNLCVCGPCVDAVHAQTQSDASAANAKDTLL